MSSETRPSGHARCAVDGASRVDPGRVSFTPGPWFVSHEDSEPPRPFVCTAGDVICLMDPNHSADDPSDEANARLIAAAPELYEIAARVASVARDGTDTISLLLELNAIAKDADAAIRKARGESQ
jgi:hypothetical protein